MRLFVATESLDGEAERVHPATVAKWRHRFSVDRLEGLVDAPRPGAERRISDEMIEAVVVDTLESAPPDATHWSTRDLGKSCGPAVMAGNRCRVAGPGRKPKMEEKLGKEDITQPLKNVSQISGSFGF